MNTFDEFVSDPAKPVPTMNRIDIGMPREYMTADQRFAAERPDVLVYQTPVLEKDMTIAGTIEVELYVSTTGTDADWIVKLIDVYPDDYPDPDPNPTGVRMGGYQQLVRGEPFRGKFRNSFEKPEPFKPGEVAKIKFTMPDVLHTFRPGHRLMVQVQSTWFPLVDRNPQTFCDIYKCDEKDFVKADPPRLSRRRASIEDHGAGGAVAACGFAHTSGTGCATFARHPAPTTTRRHLANAAAGGYVVRVKVCLHRRRSTT